MPMSAVHATARLTASLQAIAAALASPDAEALLAGEAALAGAIDEARAAASHPCADRDVLLEAVQQARAALTRCRSLGHTASDLVHTLLALDADGHYDGLGGVVAAAAPRGARLHARL